MKIDWEILTSWDIWKAVIRFANMLILYFL